MEILKENLIRAREVLSGLDGARNESHPGQFSEGVISFADGEGMRRPHPQVVASGVTSLFETELTSLEKYFFQKKNDKLEQRIASDFLSDGIHADLVSNICITSGTSNLFNSFFYSISKPGDYFLTSPGFYHSLVNWCNINNINLSVVNTKRRNGFKLTPASIEEWFKESGINTVKGLVLFNPTYYGAVYEFNELQD